MCALLTLATGCTTAVGSHNAAKATTTTTSIATVPTTTTTTIPPTTTTTATANPCSSSAVYATVSFRNVVSSNPSPVVGPGGATLPAGGFTDTSTSFSGTVVNDSTAAIFNVEVDVTVDYANGTVYGLQEPLTFDNGPGGGTLPGGETSTWTDGVDNDDAATSATVNTLSYQTTLPPYSCEQQPG
jgi:hypothetical protein